MKQAASSAAARCPRSVSIAAIRQGVIGMLAGCAALLSGCAIYHPKPLPSKPDLARAPALTVPASDLGIPELKPEPFDLAKGLTETNVVTLAVVDNPRLKAVRQQAGVARAQMLEAGLLPDPEFSGGPLKSALPFTGYAANLAENIEALVTRGAAKDAARAHLNEINLEILWQEWQVAAQARELYIQTRALDQLRRVLDQRRTLLATLYARDETSLKQGFVTVSAVTADFSAWDSAETAWRAFELQDNQTRHALDELLGIAPDVHLRLQGPVGEHTVTQGEYRSALAALPHRPDLLALQAGYHSQEELLREAILAQFPLISAGVEQTLDPLENKPYIGFNVTLTLPLFNRNRGPIAVGRASREQLYQAYQASLDETTNQADQVWKAVLIMQQQLGSLDQQLSGLEQAAAEARESLRRGTVSLADYASVKSNALATQAEEIQLRASLEQAQAALAVLLAMPL
ncbi:MAG: TolC family protein [Steroidobacteraceae bacterium]